MSEIQDNRDKALWRRQMTVLRDSLSPADRERRSIKLCGIVEHEVLSLLRKRLARPLSLCIYAPFRSEASPLPLLDGCWEKGDQIYAPRIISNQEGMELRKVEALSNWIPGKWGIPEPDPLQTAIMERTLPLDVVLVPGIAFNIEGSRLGYGGGYYDRIFAARQWPNYEQTLWIGFAFANQVVSEPLPSEAHDLRLNGLATEEQLIRFDEGE